MHMNFTVSDLLGSAQAFAVMPLFVLVPGYVLGWLLNVLDFRRSSLEEQLLLSTPLSLAVCPVAGYLLGLSASFAGVWFFYGCFWTLFPAIVALQAREPSGMRRGCYARYMFSRNTWIALESSSSGRWSYF